MLMHKYTYIFIENNVFYKQSILYIIYYLLYYQLLKKFLFFFHLNATIFKF